MIKLTIKEDPRGRIGDVAANITEAQRREILHLLDNVRRPSTVKVPVFLGSLPLGARFTYTSEPDAKVWVLLDRGGFGKVAEANPPSTRLQSVCMAVEQQEDINTFEVYVERAK